jgi:myo-inositol catabolism protein IolC
MTIVERALELVPDHARIGLGSGRAAQSFIRALGEKVRSRAIQVYGVPTSEETAIEEVQDAGVEPDVWKIEGLDRREDCLKVVEAAQRNGRDKVACIVLGRGENEQKVREWVVTAAPVPGFIGFAVGRTSFWDPLIDWKENKTSREAVVSEIACRFRDVFEQAQRTRRAA